MWSYNLFLSVSNALLARMGKEWQMVVMRYVECQLHECMKPCFICGCLSPLFVFPPSLLPPLSPSPPTQGDDPLNSADDDEDSDGEGAHFDTEDNIVCQFEKVRCSPEYFRVQVIHF